MKDFLLIYRADYSLMASRTDEEKQDMTKHFMAWLDNIAAQGNMVDKGNRLAPTGRIVSPGEVVTNGPYTEVKEFIGGYSVIRADSYEDALVVAKDCPTLNLNGMLEFREICYII